MVRDGFSVEKAQELKLSTCYVQRGHRSTGEMVIVLVPAGRGSSSGNLGRRQSSGRPNISLIADVRSPIVFCKVEFCASEGQINFMHLPFLIDIPVRSFRVITLNQYEDGSSEPNGLVAFVVALWSLIKLDPSSFKKNLIHRMLLIGRGFTRRFRNSCEGVLRSSFRNSLLVVTAG